MSETPEDPRLVGMRDALRGLTRPNRPIRTTADAREALAQAMETAQQALDRFGGPPEPPDVLPPRQCPDGGACHHGCDGSCFRVRTSSPLSGVYPGDRWPLDELRKHLPASREGKVIGPAGLRVSFTTAGMTQLGGEERATVSVGVFHRAEPEDARTLARLLRAAADAAELDPDAAFGLYDGERIEWRE